MYVRFSLLANLPVIITLTFSLSGADNDGVESWVRDRALLRPDEYLAKMATRGTARLPRVAVIDLNGHFAMAAVCDDGQLV